MIAAIQDIHDNLVSSNKYTCCIYLDDYLCIINKEYIHIYSDNIITTIDIFVNQRINIRSRTRHTYLATEHHLPHDIIEKILYELDNGFHILIDTNNHETNFSYCIKNKCVRG